MTRSAIPLRLIEPGDQGAETGGAVVSLRRPARKQAVLLVGLYSSRYAAIGESHGLSVLAGVLAAAPDVVARVEVLDMAAYGEEQPDRIVAAIRANDPDVIGIAVPYGAYSVLEAAHPAIREAAEAVGARLVFGGALATYLASDVLAIAPNGVVASGEGEASLMALLTLWAHGYDDLDDVPGVSFLRHDRVVTTNRSLAALATIPPPSRDHVVEIARAGGQVYAESSRACSWAACTFCLRGLTDIDGRPREYRRFPARRLATDLRRLHELGIESVVFADEDFLGNDIEAVGGFLDELSDLVTPDVIPAFEFSTTIHSVYRHEDDRPTNLARVAVLDRLRPLGLRKVFLGIESGCDSQLRRYAKGHLAEECAAAIYRVRAAGLRLEVGFIMFDPLCTLAEVADNVAFIRRTGIVTDISAVTNELRLQTGSRYLHILERREREAGHQFYERSFDKDTLSHSYSYADPDVARLIAGIRPIAHALQGVTYPLKNVSRHGEGTPAADELRGVLARWRDGTLTAIEAGIDAARDGLDPRTATQDGMHEAAWRLAAEAIGAHRRLPAEVRDHAVLLGAIDGCRTLLDDPESLLRADPTVAP